MTAEARSALPYVPITEVQEPKGQRWTRTEIPRGTNVTESRLPLDQDGVLITHTRLKRDDSHLVIDSSVRMRAEDGSSYILRYDSEGNDFRVWEFIFVQAGAQNEQGVHKYRTRNPNITPNDLEPNDLDAEEWKGVRESLDSLLFSLPNGYPEKNELKNAWAPVTITDKSSQEEAPVVQDLEPRSLFSQKATDSLKNWRTRKV